MSDHYTSLETGKGDDKDQLMSIEESTPEPTYRLYKRRFLGLVGLIFLNLVSAMPWPWYGPIANNMAQEFDFSLDQINWLGNIMALVYLPISLLVPHVVARYGIRRCCELGALCMLLSAWIRYAGTPHTLSPGGAYALIFIGQFFSAVAQPVYQVLSPKFSETWFDLKGRTTATMILSLANPIGGALGQLISPLVGDTRQSILVLAILSTAVIPFLFLIQNAPPIPPTYAASTPSPSIWKLLRELVAPKRSNDTYLTTRERLDFAIVILVFGIVVGTVNMFSIMSAQILQPVGYSSDTSGLMGACLLLTGLVAAVITSPLFDRVFTHHLAITAKILIPIVAAAWISLIWAVRPDNTGPLFAIMAIIGAAALTLLPAALELGVELTRSAGGSSSILWFSGNLFCVIFILCNSALRAGPDADPPLNMRRSLIFNASFLAGGCTTVFLLKGKQARKILDEQKHREAIELSSRRGQAGQTGGKQ